MEVEELRDAVLGEVGGLEVGGWRGTVPSWVRYLVDG